MINISYKDMKLFFIGSCIYTFLLLLALDFNKVGLMILEQTFNFIKIICGVYLTVCWIKHWHKFIPEVRVAFFTFNISVSMLSIYNAYRTIIVGTGINYIFNFSYHFIVIALCLGQIAFMKNYIEVKKSDGQAIDNAPW